MTWNAYGVAVHQQRAIWSVPIAVHIWSFYLPGFRCFAALANDNGRSAYIDRAQQVQP